MAAKRKTWQEKLADKPGYPKVIALQAGFPCYNAVHKMGAEAGDPVVLVNPSDVVALMRQVPPGLLTTLGEICRWLARKYQAKGCCNANRRHLCHDRRQRRRGSQTRGGRPGHPLLEDAQS